MDRVRTGLAVIFLTLTVLVSGIMAGVDIMFAPERNKIVVRDIASGSLFKVERISPTALTGDGLGFRLKAGIAVNNLEHQLRISASRAVDFRYESRMKSIKRPGDKYKDFRLSYRFLHFLWSDVFLGSDLGIGPEIQFARIRTVRRFSQDTRVNFNEQYCTLAFSIAWRYSPVENWRCEIIFANGGLYGFEHSVHSFEEKLTKRNIINGWVTRGIFSLTWCLSHRWKISLVLQRREVVEIGRVFQLTAAENRFGLGISYRWKGL